MSLNRVVVEYSGPQVKGNAVSVLHFLRTGTTPPDVAALGTAFNIVKQLLPVGVTITIPAAGDVIDETTGTLTGTWATGTATNIACTGAATAAAGVGGCVTWNTSMVVNGRRLRGRTFVVPLNTGCYDNDGTLVADVLGVMNSFAAQVQAVTGFSVWHRPGALGPGSGISSVVTSYRVRDKVAMLTSRRD